MDAPIDAQDGRVPADAIPEGAGRVVRVGGVEVAVFRHGGRCFALLDRCPHAGGSLGRGWVEGNTAVCPLHYWRFRLEDGRCVAGGEEDVTTFACEEREGWVWIEVG